MSMRGSRLLRPSGRRRPVARRGWSTATISPNQAHISAIGVIFSFICVQVRVGQRLHGMPGTYLTRCSALVDWFTLLPRDRHQGDGRSRPHYRPGVAVTPPPQAPAGEATLGGAASIE
jgi:hypothetical protein